MFDYLIFSDSNFNELESEYQEAKNMLKYTFRIDFNNISHSQHTEREDSKRFQEEKKQFNSHKKVPQSKYIHEIFAHTYKACKNYKYHLDFFSTELNSEYISEHNIYCMIENHCVLTTLHTIKTLLYKDEKTSITEIGKHSQYLGFYSYRDALNKGCSKDKLLISMQRKNLMINNSTKSELDDYININKNVNNNNNNNNANILYNKKPMTIGSIKSTWSKLSKRFNNNISSKNIENISYDIAALLDKNKISEFSTERDFIFTILNFNMQLSYVASQNNILNNKGLTSLTIANNFQQHLEYYEKFVTLSHKGNLSISRKYGNIDGLLYAYNIERYFCPQLINNLCNMASNNISTKEMDNNLCKLLAKSTLLPNVFSRNYFVNLALSYYNENNIFDNYWDARFADRRQFAQFTQKKSPSSDILSRQWCKLFNNYIYYLSYILFPIFEKTFFITFYESIEKENNGILEVNEILKIMEEKLISFINENLEFIKFGFCSDDPKRMYDSRITLYEDEYYNCYNNIKEKFIDYRRKRNNNYPQQYTFKRTAKKKYAECRRLSSIFSTISSEIYSNNNFQKLFYRKFDLNYFWPNKDDVIRKLHSSEEQINSSFIEQSIINEIIKNYTDYSNL